MSWARVGMKVVCVDDAWNVGEPSPLREGTVYTIAQVLREEGLFEYRWSVGFSLVLVEAANPSGRNVGFKISRFRPLVSNKTEAEDLALFRHHLDVKSPELVQ